MSQGVVVWTGEKSEEEYPLLTVLAFVWVITFLLGSLCGLWIGRWWPVKPLRSTSSYTSWERVTRRAIHFLAKRRRVSLAFSNYRNTNLRGAGFGAAKSQPRRRVATPSRILHEGFAIPRHGSDRGRAPGDNHSAASSPMGGD